MQESPVSKVPEQVKIDAPDNEIYFVNLLRRGDEKAFITLIEQYHTALLHVAMEYIPIHATAEEIVQETWMAVLEGIDRFEGRSSLKTWLFRILSNRAKTRAWQEGRSVPFSSLREVFDGSPESVASFTYLSIGDTAQLHSQCIAFPSRWQEVPEEHVLSRETLTCISQAIEALHPHQRKIIFLRDIRGWTSEETCAFLGISEGNQRVLLHRARAKVRSALKKYFGE